MNIFRKDWKVLGRAPFIWVMLAVFCFASTWIFWVLLDGYIQKMPELVQLSSPYGVAEIVMGSYIKTLAMLMIFVVSVLSGRAFAHERSNGTLPLLLQHIHSDWLIVRQKYLHVLVWNLFFCLPLLLVCITLWLGGAWSSQMLVNIIGFFIMILWMSALGLWMSIIAPNTAVAILMSFMVFATFWVIGQSAASEAEWGKNWLLVLSPAYHLKLLNSGYVSMASLWYFLAGSAFGLYMTKTRLKHIKRVL